MHIYIDVHFIQNPPISSDVISRPLPDSSWWSTLYLIYWLALQSHGLRQTNDIAWLNYWDATCLSQPLRTTDFVDIRGFYRTLVCVGCFSNMGILNGKLVLFQVLFTQAAMRIYICHVKFWVITISITHCVAIMCCLCNMCYYAHVFSKVFLCSGVVQCVSSTFGFAKDTFLYWKQASRFSFHIQS